MAHANPSDAELKQLLTDATTIAMVGASSNPDKASHGIMQKLQRVGYRVIPVNPRETEILGERVYPSLIDVPERIDIVDVFRRAEDTPAIADEAVTIGAKALWLQTGIVERGRGRARQGRRADGGDGRLHRRDAQPAAGRRQRRRLSLQVRGSLKRRFAASDFALQTCRAPIAVSSCVTSPSS